MEKKNTFSAPKWIAVILILAFFGINFYKTNKEGGPLEQKFNEKNQEQTVTRKFDKKYFPTQNVEKLKYAYTGNWEKNEISANAQAGDYAFTAPENTRGKIEATAATKKVEAKKKAKKLAQKKKAKKIAKRTNNRRSMFNADYEASAPAYIANNYYTQPKNQTRAPSDEEEKVKKLTAAEVYSLVTAAKSIAPMTAELAKETMSLQTYYTVAGMLLSSDKDDLKKLGFEAISQYQSSTSLNLYAKHIDDEMTEETKAFADSTLAAYNQPKYIRLLTSTLRSSENSLKIISSNLLKDITLSIMQSQAQSGENVVYNEQQITMFKSQLNSTLAVIEAALQTSLDSAVSASFNSTRDILNQFLD